MLTPPIFFFVAVSVLTGAGFYLVMWGLGMVPRSPREVRLDEVGGLRLTPRGRVVGYVLGESFRFLGLVFVVFMSAIFLALVASIAPN